MSEVPQTDPASEPEKKPDFKYPLKGTVITREEFATETRRQKRLALHTDNPRSITWQEARSRAYQALLRKHYPRIK